MADLKSPKVSHIRGEVVSVSNPIPSKNKAGAFFRVVTVEDWNTGGSYARPVSESFFQGVNGGSGLKNILQEGKFVDLEINHLVKDETEYVDTEGEIKTHTSTSEVIAMATNISAAKYQMVFKAGLMQAQA